MEGCECGCGTSDFIFGDHSVNLPRSLSANPTPWSPEIVDGDGELVGGLILFLKDGLLQSLEVVSYLDPLPLPGDGSGELGDCALTAVMRYPARAPNERTTTMRTRR